MLYRVLPLHLIPAVLLTLLTGAGLGYLRYAPARGVPVAAVFAPGISPPAAIARLAAGWRVLGVGAARPFAVLLLRAPDGAAAAPNAPAGAWLMLRADGAGLCGQPSRQRT